MLKSFPYNLFIIFLLIIKINSQSTRPIVKNITDLSSDYGGLITISGDNFNNIQPNGFISEISIMIGEFPCINPSETYSNSNQFTCLLNLDPNINYNDTSLLNLPISVTINGNSSENTNIRFNFDVPNLYENGYTQNGSDITFTGQRFGKSNSNSTFIIISNQTISHISIHPKIGSDIQINPPTITDFTKMDDRVWSFKMSIPENFIPGQYHAVMATHNFRLRSNNITFNIEPSISSISSPPISGGEITINGVLLNNPIININNAANENEIINCSSLNLVSSRMITCQISSGTGKDIIFNLTIDGKTYLHPFNYQAPKINNVTSITSVYGLFTISGSNFASNKLEVSVNGVQCQNPNLLNETTIVCKFFKDEIESIKQFGSNKQSITVSVNRQATTENIFEIEEIKSSSSKKINKLAIALTISIVGGVILVCFVIYISKAKILKLLHKRAVVNFKSV